MTTKEEEEKPWLSATTLSIPYFVAELVIAVICVFGNALVIISFSRVRRLRSIRNIYIVSLALADELLGVLTIPLQISISVGQPRNLLACLLALSLIDLAAYGSMFSFVAITADRLWAIAWPYSYQKKMQKTIALSCFVLDTFPFTLDISKASESEIVLKLHGICGGLWIFGGLLAHIPLMGWYNHNGWEESDGHCFYRKMIANDHLVYVYSVNVFICQITLIFANVYLYRLVAKQTKCPKYHTESNTEDFSSCWMYLKLWSDAKHAVKVGRIVLVFLVCQLPLGLLYWVRGFGPAEFAAQIPPILSTYLILLVHSNSAINPILYALHLSEFRSAMKDTCKVFLFRIKYKGNTK